MVVDGVREQVREALQIALTLSARASARALDSIGIMEVPEGGVARGEVFSVEGSMEAPGGSNADQARAFCRAQLANVHLSLWWEKAAAADIVGMYELAAAWRGWDLVAWDADEIIRQEVHARYGITFFIPQS